MLWGEQESLYDGLLAVDDFSLFFKVFFMGIGVFIILSSMDFVKNNLEHQGEFYGLIIFSVLGMNIMAQARELLTAYIALELLSFSLYVLAAYAKNNAKSNEGGLKYIIIGAFSSAILLYGISMVYSTLGVTKFEAIAAGLTSASEVIPSDGFDGLASERYDLIVSNPPYHEGKAQTGRVVERLVRGAPDYLVTGGSLMLVTQRRFPLAGLMKSTFKTVDVSLDAGPHRVWFGKK